MSGIADAITGHARRAHPPEADPVTRDRTGEPITKAEDVGHRCDRGWIDADADRPRPCLRCRPWLAHGAVNIPTPRRSR